MRLITDHQIKSHPGRGLRCGDHQRRVIRREHHLRAVRAALPQEPCSDRESVVTPARTVAQSGSAAVPASSSRLVARSATPVDVVGSEHTTKA